MDLKYLIVTTTPDSKILNKLLWSLRDWQFGKEPTWDNCTILRSPADISRSAHHEVDEPPIWRSVTTDFHGKSIQEVEELMLAQDWETPTYINQFMLLDQRGVDEETIIFADRAQNGFEDIENGADFYKGHYNKVRVPWMKAHIMWCSLAVQYIGFETFTAEETAPEDGWCTYKNIVDTNEHVSSFVEKRDALVRDLAKRDLVKYVIVTTEVDVKLVNKLLLSLRDWEDGDDPTWDASTIIWTMEKLLGGLHSIDRPPVHDIPTGEASFRGKSVQEVEAMVLGRDDEEPYLDLWLLLDEQGVREGTIIIADRASETDADDEFRLLRRYNKVRVPWLQAHIMYVNLQIANTDFWDFCEEDEDDDVEWFTHRSVESEKHYEQIKARRDEVFRDLA